TTSDTDVVQIAGIKSDGTVTGQSIYVTALKAGEALITCSHEKAASDLQFYVVVPGTGEKTVTLNKTYMTLTKGSSGSTLKATIENAESNSDYNNLIWTCEGANGAEIARVMGSGQSVTIYPLAVGEATVMAQLPDSASFAKCTVRVEAGKSFAFEVNSKRVEPKHSKTVKYKVSPPSAVLSWSMIQQDDYFTYSDLGCDNDGNGQVEIIGLQKEGNGTLICVTDSGAKGQLTVTVNWDYEFTVDTRQFSGSPDKSYQLKYSVKPTDAKVEVSGNGLCEFSHTTDGLGNGKIEIMPHTEGTDSIIVRASNPNDGNKEIGSYTVAGSFYYDSLTVRYKKQGDVSYADNTKSAWWSSFENDVITLGDGEKMTFAFEVAEAKTKGLSITASLQSKRDANILLAPGATDGQFILSHKADTQVPAYRINKGYRPTFKGSTSYPDGTPIKLTDFSSYTWSDCDYFWDWGKNYDRIIKYFVRNDKVSSNLYAISTGWHEGGTHKRTLSNKDEKNGDWGVVRDTSLDGTCYSVAEFQKYLWYYVPAFQYDSGDTDEIHLVHEYGEIDTDHIDATYCTVTTDTAVVSSSQADVLVVTFEHNGKQQKKYYPIYVEVRNSSCTQK
ncbi:MAG: hypothetical protein HDR32_00180, partial [Treponema sp.]|nr:hypothetical protein [Treponema sp.]